MFPDLIKGIVRVIGSACVLLDGALPGTVVFYPPVLFFVIIVLTALVLLIVVLFRKHRRKEWEQAARRTQAQLAAQGRKEPEGAAPGQPGMDSPRETDKKED